MRVIFPLIFNGSTIVYPDSIEKFSNTEIVGNNLVADYVGEMSFSPYIEPAVSISATKKITRLAYLNRLEPELKEIYLLAQTDIDIQIYKDKVLATDHFDLSDPAVIADLNKLKVVGIYSQQRIDEILTAPLTKSEGVIE